VPCGFFSLIDFRVPPSSEDSGCLGPTADLNRFHLCWSRLLNWNSLCLLPVGPVFPFSPWAYHSYRVGAMKDLAFSGTKALLPHSVFPTPFPSSHPLFSPRWGALTPSFLLKVEFELPDSIVQYFFSVLIWLGRTSSCSSRDRQLRPFFLPARVLECFPLV